MSTLAVIIAPCRDAGLTYAEDRNLGLRFVIVTPAEDLPDSLRSARGRKRSDLVTHLAGDWRFEKEGKALLCKVLDYLFPPPLTASVAKALIEAGGGPKDNRPN